MKDRISRMSLAFALLIAGLMAAPRMANAHHGWAEFDYESTVKMEGTVVDFHFTNPHCVVELRVQDDKGKVTQWQGEFASPGELARKGWTAATLQVGDKIAMTGHPAKNRGPAMHVSGIRLANGKDLIVPAGN
jgi:hypothetical protein